MTFLQMFLEDNGFDPFKYSGRGMFGRYCVAVRIDGDDDVSDFLVEVFSVMVEAGMSRTEMQSVLDELGGCRTDNLGRDTVVYWQNVCWHENDEEDEETDDDDPA